MQDQIIPGPNDPFAQLPPRPDPETGEPFPPHGLSYFRGEQTTPPEHDKNRETRFSHKPEPPQGFGPVLAWHRESRHGKIMTVLACLAIVVVLFSVLQALKGDSPVGWVQYWPVWVVFAVGTVLASSPFSYLTYAAGADWLVLDITKWGKTKRIWVALYELTRVDAAYGGPTFHLDLNTKRGGLSASFEELQRDRRIWDLVYNGIMHSVANGAQVGNQAIGILQLDQTLALRLRKLNAAEPPAE